MAGGDYDYVTGVLPKHDNDDMKFAIIGTSMVKYQHNYLPANFSILSFSGKDIKYISEMVSSSLIDADVLYIHAGSNDICNGESISRSVERYAVLIEQLHHNNPALQIVASSILPRRESRLGNSFGLSSSEYNSRSNTFNTELKCLRLKFSFVTILDHPEFRFQLLSSDGVHLDFDGNRQFAMSFLHHSTLMKPISTLPVPFVNDLVDERITPVTNKPLYADMVRNGRIRRPVYHHFPPETHIRHSKKPVKISAQQATLNQQAFQRKAPRPHTPLMSMGLDAITCSSKRSKLCANKTAEGAFSSYCDLEVGDLMAKLHPKCFSGQKVNCSERVKKTAPAKCQRKKKTLQALQRVPIDCPFCIGTFKLVDHLLDHIITECTGLKEERATRPMRLEDASTCSTGIYLNEVFVNGGGPANQHDEQQPQIISVPYSIKSHVVGIQVSLNPKSTDFISPETELREILEILNDSNYVKLPYGNFDKVGILELLEIHTIITSVEDSKWVSSVTLDNYHLKTSIPLSKIRLFFHNITISKGSDFLQLSGPYQISKDSLCSLLYNRWIWDCVILKFFDILMLQQQEVYAGYLSNISDCFKAGTEVKSKYGNNIKTFVFAMNVQLDALPNSVHLRTNISGLEINKGSHFSFCVLEMGSENPELIYIDTLGYPVPPSLENALKTFLLGYGNCNFDNLKVSSCHTCFGQLCSNRCSAYPKQTCASICGPAVICGIALYVFYNETFRNLITMKRGSDFPKNLSALNYFAKNLSLNSTLLRVSIINWLLDGKITIDNILYFDARKIKGRLSLNNKNRNSCPGTFEQHDKQSKQNVHCTDKVGYSELDKKIRDAKIKLPDMTDVSIDDTICSTEVNEKGQSYKLLKEVPINQEVKSKKKKLLEIPKSIDMFLRKSPVLIYVKPKRLSLRFFLQNTVNPVKKNFKCTKAGKDDTAAIEQVNKFLGSLDCQKWLAEKFNKGKDFDISCCKSLDELLHSKPIIKNQSPNHVIVRFLLKNGKEFSKKFTHSNYQDEEQTSQDIRSFIDNGDAFSWIKSKLESLHWVEGNEIEVGSKTKLFFDEFTFDVTKHVTMHASVRAKYHDQTARVSVVENQLWGKTHRFDECYSFNGAIPDGNFAAVTIYIKCASKSPQCRSKCFTPLTDIDLSVFVDSNTDIKDYVCPACKEDISVPSKVCEKCKTENSLRWHVFDHMQYCSACYQYKNTYGIDRPSKLADPLFMQDRKKAVYNDHFTCNWQLKLVLYSDNMNVWKVYSWHENSKYHQLPAVQINKRPSLFHRDIVDLQRVSQRSTAKQIYINQNRKTSIHINNPGQHSQSFNSISQIQNRVKRVDKNELKLNIKNLDEFQLPGSDWRNTEKILESNLESVLLFQRGFNNINRDYHIVIGSDSNLINVRKYGQHVLGYDTKHDFVSVRFSTGMVTFADAKNKGRVACVGICNREDTRSHVLTLQVLLANIPCSDSACSHERQLYIFNDQNGFFYFRPCSLKEPFKPMIQHDKSTSIKAAVEEIGLLSTLCNFHALNALREHIISDTSLKMFLRPLEAGFKVIMRSWNKETYEILINQYIDFIKIEIPETFVDTETKDKFIGYLNNNWFRCVLAHDFTSEVIYKVPFEERRNPLLLTDNITERKFKEIDENLLNSHLNKSIANFVRLMIDKFLSAEQSECHHRRIGHGNFRIANVIDTSKELNKIDQALKVIDNNGVIEISNPDGWMLVLKMVDKTNQININDIQLSDTFFTGEANACSEFENFDDMEQNFSQKSLQSLVKDIGDEHNYDAGNSCKTLIFELQTKACILFKDFLHFCLPNSLQNLYRPDYHICNLQLGICSCMYFIVRGQPYFCKHLYACLANVKGITLSSELFDAYLRHVPTFTIEKSIDDPIPCNRDRIELLISVSHSASDTEMKLAQNGSILKLLHDKRIPLSLAPGRQAKRFPHYGGFRRKDGGVKHTSYSLVEDSSSQVVEDPYRPTVKFPENSKNRFGGRKRCRVTSRGLNFAQIVHNAVQSASMKRKETSRKNDDIDKQTTNNDSDFSQDIDIQIEQEIEQQDAKKPDKLKYSTLEQKAVRIPTEKNIICTLCINKNNMSPFCCSSQNILMRHISAVHCLKLFSCAECWKDSGTLVSFETENILKKHASVYHVLNETKTTSSTHISSNKSSSCDKNGSNENVTNEGLSLDSHTINENNFTEAHSTKNQSKKTNAKLELGAKKVFKRKPVQNGINTRNNANTNSKLIEKGSGARNIAQYKLKLVLKHKRHITPNELIHEGKKKRQIRKKKFPCPVCNEECKDDPPSICCDVCDDWFHWQCVHIYKEPNVEKWYCLECDNAMTK